MLPDLRFEPDNEIMNKLTFCIHFEEHSDCQLDIDLNEQMEEAYDWEYIKKRILSQYGYPKHNKKSILLFVNNICVSGKASMSIPIVNQENYAFIIGLLIEQKSTVQLAVKILKPLTKKKDIEETALRFDSDGSIESDDNDTIRQTLEYIRPRFGRYTGNDLVRCAFCHKSSQDKQTMKKLGPYYGPFKPKEYVHLLCVIWCSKVFVDEKTGKLRNVIKAIEQARDSFCSYCGRDGAGLGCHKQKCPLETHYECALPHCEFNWNKYTFLCQKCRPPINNTQQQSVKDESESYSQQVKIEIE